MEISVFILNGAMPVDADHAELLGTEDRRCADTERRSARKIAGDSKSAAPVVALDPGKRNGRTVCDIQRRSRRHGKFEQD